MHINRFNKKRIIQIHEAISGLPLSLKLNFSIANEIRDKIRGQQNIQILLILL